MPEAKPKKPAAGKAEMGMGNEGEETKNKIKGLEKGTGLEGREMGEKEMDTEKIATTADESLRSQNFDWLARNCGAHWRRQQTSIDITIDLGNGLTC